MAAEPEPLPVEMPDADPYSGPPSAWPSIDAGDPQQVLGEWLACRSDPAYFIARYVKIRHVRRGVIPFDLWDWQLRLLDTWQEERLCIVLKARQMGVSELIEAYALWLVRFYDAKTVLFLSKTEKDANELLARLTFAFNWLPAWLQTSRPDAVDVPQPPDLVVLGNVNMSTFTLEHVDASGRTSPSVVRSLAASASAGRSASASLVVLDEWAHQEHDGEIWSGISPTIATGGQLIGISTANGMGNTFHHVWEDAERGDNDFAPVFLPWYLHPERDRVWYEREKRQYRHDLPRFHQEFPENALEAFIQSGRPVFDLASLQRARARIQEEVAAGLAPLEEGDGLTVWEPPLGETTDARGQIVAPAHQAHQAHRYIVFADVAEGLVRGDFDAACVLDRATLRQVAELRGHWPPDVYARKLWALAARYNGALLAVERNNHGHSVLLALTSGLARPMSGAEAQGQIGGWGYAQGYRHVYHHPDPTVPGAAPSLRAGWPTTSVTKPLMIDTLARLLASGDYQPRSEEMLSEALHYVYDDRGGMGASGQMHDDLVMAHAGAVYLATQPEAGQVAFSYLQRAAQLVQGRVVEAASRQQSARLGGPGSPHQSGLTALPGPRVVDADPHAK